ncbi:MAG TPA: hypothetical protein ENN81_03690 [Phycisphaerales bacterium]|nr:hypothetical protein [Phycisphaerales bacterium]
MKPLPSRHIDPADKRRLPGAIALAAACLTLLSGCQESIGIPPGSYYINPDKPLAAIGKVALLEPANHSDYENISGDVAQALYKAIQRRQLFSLTLFDSGHPIMKIPGSNLDTSYSLKQLADIQNACKCNAVLMGSVVQYKPYPHLNLVLRLKLIDLSDGQLIWAVEQVWDSADTEIHGRIHAYAKKQLTSETPTLQEQMVTVSPLAFIAFAAYETAQTLTPQK